MLTVHRQNALRTPRARFHDVPHDRPGHVMRYTSVMGLQVPAAVGDVIDGHVTLTLSSKKTRVVFPAGNLFQRGAPASVFAAVWVLVSDRDQVLEHDGKFPPGRYWSESEGPFCVGSGENLCQRENLRPYWQPTRLFTFTAWFPDPWLHVWIGPSSGHCDGTQAVDVFGGDQQWGYSQLVAKVHKGG